MWDEDFETGSFENFGGGLGGLRMEVVVPGISPEDDLRSALVSRRLSAKPGAKCFRGEGRNAALFRHASEKFRQVSEHRKLGDQVGESGRVGRDARKNIDVAEGVVAQRARAALIVVREEFGFVGGDIDSDWAIALAAFARESQIERMFHRVFAPVALEHIAAHQLPQQVRTAAGGVFFVVRDAVAGTHHAALLAAALADTHAAQCGVGHAAAVVSCQTFSSGWTFRFSSMP